MAEIKRGVMFGKLNDQCYRTIESATVFCEKRGNPHVELVHWFHLILQLADSDLHRIMQYFGMESARVAKDVIAALDRLPRSSTSLVTFSPHLHQAVERGWVYASLLFGDSRIRFGHLIVGILKTDGLRDVFLRISPEFARIKLEVLTDQFAEVLAGSPEDRAAEKEDGLDSAEGARGRSGAEAGGLLPGKQQALARFSIDLTDKARKGEINPVLGRDEEIRQIVDILMRRRQNNPILTGEAGVGKTAVVEGFALRIAAKDVPPSLRDVTLRTLDLGLLQAGASMKGEFEERLRQVIDEVQRSLRPIILFIDEAHALIGAGGAAGQGDAANLLKPALARGTLRTIAATTWGEYKKFFEEDAALARRFQVIKIEEPSEEKTVRMIRGLTPVLEKHHRVHVRDEALLAAARLARRYIPSRQLPDKAVSLIDTACARVAILQHSTPPQVEDCRRQIEALETELQILDRETALGADHSKRHGEITGQWQEEKKRVVQLEQNWQEEKTIVDKILELRARLTGTLVKPAAAPPNKPAPSPAAAVPPPTEEKKSPPAPTPPMPQLSEAERAALLAELRQKESELKTLQGEHPLILPEVDEQAVAAVVADWTGIPVGRMVKNEIEAVLKLANNLEKRVVGQRHALDAIASRIQTARARLDNPGKPVGVFLLAGPSGVGKTETALALADTLYGGQQSLITINMSEFQEEHTVSTLKGAPPGYKGYGKGGVLTEAVRRRPYSVVLLDEVEKAHKDVHEIFFQVFDKGMMDDAEGRRIDFKNTVILLTTNAGSDLIMSLCNDPETKPDPAGIAQALRQPLLKIFPPALLGRLVVVPYYPLSDEVIASIIRLQLDRITRRLAENHGVIFAYEDAVLKHIASRCTEPESGARVVDAILTHTLLPEMSRGLLARQMDGQATSKVSVGVKDGDFTYQIE